jgi:hypothetical protein
LTADVVTEQSVNELTYGRPTLRAPAIQLLEPEPLWKRYGYGIIALALSLAFFYAVMSYWVPAHAGTDQNGYLVGGKMFAQTLTMRQSPVHPGTRDQFDPHQFVGRMWVGADLGTPNERYYPKYPLGLPALYAVMIWIGSLFGPAWGVWLSYGLSPVAMSLAVLGTYLLARRFAGSFGGLLAAIVFGTSPVSLQLAINPNSHAAAVCCVVWGMYFLIGWWQFRGMTRAIAAGFLLGYAATIRYSEATLILPAALVALFALRWRDWKTLTQAIALLAAWAVPIGLLVLYNHFAIGDLTGYDPTNESSGFGWGYAADNWETMLRNLNTGGLAQMFPVALAGLVWMFWWNWRAASVLAAWIIPCLLTYTFYYWAPDNAVNVFSIGYLRFFTTILPGLALCFFWLVSRLSAWASTHHGREGSPALSIGVTLIVGLLATGIVAVSLTHAWLGEHDPADAGLHRNWLVDHLKPAETTSDTDTDTPRLAKIEFDAYGFGAIAAGAAVALIALCLMQGRAVVPAVGAGLFTLLVVAMQVTDTLPGLEADQTARIQLALKADAIRALIPDGSAVFCQDQAVLNDVQFLGDYALYDGQSFRADWVRNLPNAEPPDQPQGLDPGRRDALYKRLKDLTQTQLDEQARGIMHDSLMANRRVFFVIPLRPNEPIPKKLRKAMGFGSKEKAAQETDQFARLCPPDRFASELVSIWPGYVPGLTEPKVNKPRGLRMPPPTDPQGVRQPLEFIEVSLAVPGSARG